MNPYVVLAIKHDATPHDIVQAAAMALRKREYTAREIADARKQLMNPEARMILDFVHHVDVESLIKPGKGKGGADHALSLVDDTGKLERLTIFDS